MKARNYSAAALRKYTHKYLNETILIISPSFLVQSIHFSTSTLQLPRNLHYEIIQFKTLALIIPTTEFFFSFAVT